MVGFIGAALLIFSYQCKSSKKLFAVQMSSNVVYMLHFFMIGAFSGSMNLVICFLRNFTLFNSKNKWLQHKLLMWFYIVLNIVTTILTWQDIFSILPCIGTIVMTFAMWTRNGKKIRLANLFANQPAWLIYDIHSVSYSGILCDVFGLISVIIFFKRYGMKALNNEN
jgi:Bacterial inner membrane protein.